MAARRKRDVRSALVSKAFAVGRGGSHEKCVPQVDGKGAHFFTVINRKPRDYGDDPYQVIQLPAGYAHLPDKEPQAIRDALEIMG